MSPVGEKDPRQERIQVLGRSMLSHVQQVFRNADLFEPNNQIFVRLAQTLANYIKESYRLVGGCSIHVNAHQVFLEDSRVFIDSGLIESVNFLANLFASAEVGGIVFHEECWDPKVVIKTMFALRSTILDDKARGEAAIKKGLIRRHSPYVTVMKMSTVETTMTGIRDEENALRFTFRNAAKLALFVKEMDDRIQNQEPVRVNVSYRLLLNLIRINEQYPHFIHMLLACPEEDRVRGRIYFGVLMVLAVCHYLKLERQTQIDFGVAALFQCLGEQQVPPSIRNSDRIEDFRDELPDRAIRWLLDSRFVNRSLYYRAVTAFQTPLRRDNPEETPLPAVRLLRAINHVVEVWKLSSQRRPFHVCIQRLLTSNDVTVDKAFVLIIAKTFGVLPASTLVAVDEKFIATVTANSSETIKFTSIPESRVDSVRKLDWDRRDALRNEEFKVRLKLVLGQQELPNSMPSLFYSGEQQLT